MNKVSIVLALALIFGCVSADLSFNSASNVWVTQPISIPNNQSNDTFYVQSPSVTLGAVSSSLVLLAGLVNGNGQIAQRNITVKGLAYSGAKDQNFTQVEGATLSIIGENNLFSTNVTVDGNSHSQVVVYRSSLNAGALTSRTITNFTGTGLSVAQIFTHLQRVYVVYTLGNGTVLISSVDINLGTPVTVQLTNNSVTGPISCVGKSGVNQTYCVWSNDFNTTITVINTTTNVTTNVTTNTTINYTNTSTYLTEAVADFNANSVTYPALYFKGVFANKTAGYSVAYNSGKQYGAVTFINSTWSVKNANNVTFNFTSTPNDTTTPVGVFPFYDSVALVWQIGAAGSQNLTLQIVNPASGSSNSTVLYSNTTQSQVVQSSTGAAFALGRNSSNIYIGQVWGSTGMSASVLQTAFAAIFAAVAAIFFF